MLRPCTATLFIISLVMTACSPAQHWLVLRAIRAEMAQHYHGCVPLGWNPIPVDGGFILGENVELDSSGWWLPPLWVGVVPRHDISQPSVRVISQILNDLAAEGLLQRSAISGGDQYNMTPMAIRYYYDDDFYGNNPEGASYLCYSKIVFDKLQWDRQIATNRVTNAPKGAVHFVCAFSWHPSAEATWILGDRFLQAHGVLLAPTANPIVIAYWQLGGDWGIENVEDATLNRLVDPSAWPPIKSGP